MNKRLQLSIERRLSDLKVRLAHFRKGRIDAMDQHVPLDKQIAHLEGNITALEWVLREIETQ